MHWEESLESPWDARSCLPGWGPEAAASEGGLSGPFPRPVLPCPTYQPRQSPGHQGLPQGSSDTTPQPAASRLFIAGSGQQLLQASRGQTPVPRAGLNVYGLPASMTGAGAPQSQEPQRERQDGPGDAWGLAEATPDQDSPLV